jgi:hypothetical protein
MKKITVMAGQALLRRGSMLAAAALIAVCLCAGCGKKQVSTKNTDAGYAANEASDFRSAETSFREAVEQGEDPVQAYRGLGIALMGQAKYEEALAQIEREETSADRLRDKIRGIKDPERRAQLKAQFPELFEKF